MSGMAHLQTCAHYSSTAEDHLDNPVHIDNNKPTPSNLGRKLHLRRQHPPRHLQMRRLVVDLVAVTKFLPQLLLQLFQPEALEKVVHGPGGRVQGADDPSVVRAGGLARDQEARVAGRPDQVRVQPAELARTEEREGA